MAPELHLLVQFCIDSFWACQCGSQVKCVVGEMWSFVTGGYTEIDIMKQPRNPGFGAHVATRGGGGGGGGYEGRWWQDEFLHNQGPSTCGGRYSLHRWDTFQCSADLLTSWSVRHLTTDGGASSSRASWGCWSSMSREGCGLLLGPKGRVSDAPHQQVLFQSTPVKGLALLCPCCCLPEEPVVLQSSSRTIGSKELADGTLVSDQC